MKLEENNKLPEMSQAIINAKTALAGVRFSEMQYIAAAGKELALVIFAESSSNILGALTNMLNFMSTIVPGEGSYNVNEWSLAGQLNLFMAVWSITAIVYSMTMLIFVSREKERPEVIISTYISITSVMYPLENVVSFLAIYASLLFAVNPVSIFGAVIRLADVAMSYIVRLATLNLPPIKPWMLDPTSRFDSSAQVEGILLNFGGLVTSRIKEALDILKEGGLEPESKANIMSFIAGESDRVFALADDIQRKLRKQGMAVRSPDEKLQPSELKQLLNSAVRMPRS